MREIEVAYTWSWAGSRWKQEAIAVLEARDIIPVGRYARRVFQGIADSIRDGLTVGAAIQAGERAGASRRFELLNAVPTPASALNYLLPVLALALGFGLPVIVLLLVMARAVIKSIPAKLEELKALEVGGAWDTRLSATESIV